jgi:hypothetical protein
VLSQVSTGRGHDAQNLGSERASERAEKPGRERRWKARASKNSDSSSVATERSCSIDDEDTAIS